MEEIIQQYLKNHGFEVFEPQAVIFDMDGVLFNSMPNHARSWHRAMQDYGIRMDESEAYEFEGMRGVETIKLKARQQWHRELSDDEAQQMYHKKSAYFSVCPPAQKMDGIMQLMQTIKHHGLKIGVVTGSGQHSLLDHLEQEFEGFIYKQFIVTSFDVSHGKPNPEPYLVGLQKLGVQPWQAIVVENAPLGVRAAVAARIFTIAVNTGPLPDQQLRQEGANLVLKNMYEASTSIEGILKVLNS